MRRMNARLYVLALVLLSASACATTGSDARPVSHGPECDRLDAFTELATSAAGILDIM